MNHYLTLGEAWVKQLWHLAAVGDKRSPRGIPTREVRWSQFQVREPLSFPIRVEGRELADVVAVLEATSLVGQFSVPELFTDRVKKFGEFTDAGVFHGSYGQRVHGRLGDLVDLFIEDPDTRQAVLTIYDSRSDLGAKKRDVPCTLSVHFMRDGRSLEMRVTMRSNDAWLGTPYDLVQFAVLQASVAQALGMVPGRYVHTAGSLHLYERDLEKAAKVVDVLDTDHVMEFPLWEVPDGGAGSERMGAISKRARDIAFNRVEPITEFEQWANRLLWPDASWYPGMAR